MRLRDGIYLGGAIAMALGPVSAGAEKFTPKLTGEMALEIQNDYVYNVDNSISKTNDLYATIEPSFRLSLTKQLSVNAGLTLEPVQDQLPGEDRAFDDHGVYVGNLTVNYDTDDFSIYLGKFTPNFGIAWDAGPGIYGADFAKDYELAERLGLGGAINFGGDDMGRHKVSASAFFADTSFLNQSKITDRGHVRKTNGGISNTEDFSSFAVALDGDEIPNLKGLRYHLGLSHQAKGIGDAKDENAFAVGIEYAIGVAEGFDVTPMMEYARINDAGGVTDDDTTYITTGVGATYGPWNVAVAYAERDQNTVAANDGVFQFSAGYAFDFGLGVDVGWRSGDEGGEDKQTVGVLLSYGFEF